MHFEWPHGHTPKEVKVKFALVLVLFCCIAVAKDLDLVKIDISNKAEIKQLDRMGVIINQVYSDYIVAEIGKDMYQPLSVLGFKVTLLQDNISDVYRKNALMKSGRSQYLSYQQYCDSMVTIAINHPDICLLDTLGYSYQGRLLLAMKISDNVLVDEPEPAVLFEGNIHGDEKIAWAISFSLVKYLVENYPLDTVVQYLVDNREIWIAPLVNPDGYVAGVRYNGNGVDLNRNWGWMWGNESSCGSDFFSENESWRFVEFFWQYPFTTYVSYHSGTKFISEPWSYTTYLTPPEQNIIQHLSQGYAGFTGYPYGQGSIGMYEINGCTKDYGYGCGGVMAWSIEVCYIKTPPPDSIDTIFARDRPAMLLLMHKAGQGIHGVVTDSVQGDPGPPLRALIYVSPADYPSYSSEALGDFHRFYLPGTYDVTVMSPGYGPKTITGVVVPANTQDSSVFLDVRLVPNASLPVYATEVIGARYVTTSSNLTYPVWALGPHDDQAYKLDASKWIVLRFSYPIYDRPGNDLTVYRSSGSGTATIKVSNDWRGSWQTVGTASGAVSEFDIYSSGLESARYVRIEASSQFMLDAVEAPQPGTAVAGDGSGTKTSSVSFSVSPTLLKRGSRLVLTNPNTRPIEVKFFNLIGQEVERRILEPGDNYMMLARLPAGMYFLKATGSNTVRGIILID
jgi:murein tripeptide amidase MpaA